MREHTQFIFAVHRFFLLMQTSTPTFVSHHLSDLQPSEPIATISLSLCRRLELKPRSKPMPGDAGYQEEQKWGDAGAGASGGVPTQSAMSVIPSS